MKFELISVSRARLEATFKDNHEHPELVFDEKRTAGIVANELI